MTEVGWATIGGIVSVIIAQLLRWGLSRGVTKQTRTTDIYKQLQQAWDRIEELEKQADSERTLRIAMELEIMGLKKKLFAIEGATPK